MPKVRLFVVLIVGALISFQHVASAQDSEGMYLEEPRVFYGGLVAGANFTQVDGDRFAGYHKVGLNAGGVVYAQLAPHFAASIELLFTQKGSRAHRANFSVSRNFEIQQYRIDLNYAEIPILLNYFDRRRSHFGGGISYAQLVSSKETITAKPSYTVNEALYPFRKSDVNLVLNGNLHLYKGLFLNARFQYSIYSIRKKYDPELGRAQQFSNVWALRLMYLF